MKGAVFITFQLLACDNYNKLLANKKKQQNVRNYQEKKRRRVIHVKARWHHDITQSHFLGKSRPSSLVPLLPLNAGDGLFPCFHFPSGQCMLHLFSHKAFKLASLVCHRLPLAGCSPPSSYCHQLKVAVKTWKQRK